MPVVSPCYFTITTLLLRCNTKHCHELFFGSSRTPVGCLCSLNIGGMRIKVSIEKFKCTDITFLLLAYICFHIISLSSDLLLLIYIYFNIISFSYSDSSYKTRLLL